MKAHSNVLGILLLTGACGDDLAGGDGSDAGGATEGEVTTETGITSNPTSSGNPSGSTQTSSDSTGEDPPLTCSARRHTLLGDTPCARLGVGDLDADGVDDLLAIEGPISSFLGSTNADRRMYSYRGGDALLDTPEIHCCMDAGAPWIATQLDLNGDGLDDFAIMAEQDEVLGDVGNNFEDVTVWIRGPAGGFVSRGRLSRTSSGRGLQVAAGHVLAETPGLAIAGRETLWLARPDGIDLTMAAPAIPLGASAVALGITDLDEDGVEDILALLPESLVLVRSLGDGTLEIQGTYPTPIGASSMHVADIDGDGRDDVLLRGLEELAFGELEAGGPIWSTQTLSTEGPTTLVDIDDDGGLDLATTSGTELRVHLGLTDGTFADQALTLSNALGEDIADLRAADFDGDGRSELAVCDAEGVLVVQP